MVTDWGHTGAQRFQANYMVLQQAISSDRHYIIDKKERDIQDRNWTNVGLFPL